MHDTALEQDGDDAVLRFTTHFGQTLGIKCHKASSQSFRLSFTGANEVIALQGVVTEIFDSAVSVNVDGREIRAHRSPEHLVIGQTVFVTEYYGLFMENDKSSFIASNSPISEPRLLFINVDCLDGGGNTMKRYRVSPYDGSFRVITDD